MFYSVQYGSPQVEPPRPENVFIYQIYYDESSRALLDPGFLPLDNTANERPDWFEFWVIRKFLNNNTLKPDAWYGFLSPKFQQKTGLTAGYVYSEIARLDASVDVALFSSYPDHLAIFQNPFEQGDFYHPGLSGLAQNFLRKIGIMVNPLELVCCLKNSVFSNYFVAKSRFWEQWLRMANAFSDFAENGSDDARPYLADTSHDRKPVPSKVFVQERFATVLLASGAFKTHVPSRTLNFIGYPSEPSRLLVTCDLLKELYCGTKNPEFLSTYRKVRATSSWRSST